MQCLSSGVACLLPMLVIKSNYSCVKVTRKRQSEPKRGYDDACGTAHGLELIGERWALLVLRELMLGPRQTLQLKTDLPRDQRQCPDPALRRARGARGPGPGASACRRRPMSRSMRRTSWGFWRPTLIQTARAVGGRARRATIRRCRSVAVSIMLSFRTMLDRVAARGLAGTLGFRCRHDHYVGRLEGRHLRR